MPISDDLAGQVAIVTGGSRGIGRDYAQSLAARGARVVVFDLDITDRDASVDDAIVCDLTDAAATTAAVNAIHEKYGRIDILVCNAGGSSGAYAETTASGVDPQVARIVLERNLGTTMHAVQAVSQLMRNQGYGRIVTVSSLVARRVRLDGGNAHYAAAKAAVTTYTEYAARELGPYGITVNCLAPGYVATDRLMPMFEAYGVQRLLESVPAGRLGSTEDCAHALAMLVSPAAGYINGVVLPVDGGASL